MLCIGGAGEARERLIAVRRIGGERGERRLSIGLLAVAIERQGLLEGGAGRLLLGELSILVKTVAAGGEHNQRRAGDDEVLVLLPELERLVAADFLINFLKDVAHRLTCRLWRPLLARRRREARPLARWASESERSGQESCLPQPTLQSAGGAGQRTRLGAAPQGSVGLMPKVGRRTRPAISNMQLRKQPSGADQCASILALDRAGVCNQAYIGSPEPTRPRGTVHVRVRARSLQVAIERKPNNGRYHIEMRQPPHCALRRRWRGPAACARRRLGKRGRPAADGRRLSNDAEGRQAVRPMQLFRCAVLVQVRGGHDRADRLVQAVGQEGLSGTTQFFNLASLGAAKVEP